MPDLDFGDSDEEAIIILKGFAHRVNNDLYNHGKDGLLTRFSVFQTAYLTREAERERVQSVRHQENSAKLEQLMLKIGQKSYWATIVGVVATVAGLAIAILAILVTIRLAQRSDLDPLKIITSHPNPSAISSTQQISGNESRQP